MNVTALSPNFHIFTRFGVWLPPEWPSGWRRILYKTYACFVTVMLYSMFSFQFIGVFGSIGNINELVESIYTSATVFNLGCKIFNLLEKRRDIVKLLGLLEADICQIKSQAEKEIQEKCNRRIWNRTKFLCLFFETTCVTMVLTSTVKHIPERSLPLKAWLPFNYADGYTYWPVYMHQVIGLVYVGMIHASYDTFIVGVMLTLCSQLKILQYRNSEMSLLNVRVTTVAVVDQKMLEKEFVTNSIRHHQLLQQFAESFNNIIIYVIFVQYSVSSFVICVTAYKLVNLEFDNPEIIFTILYCTSMITQTFFYCWYGNEVILESANIGNSLYTSRWYSLNAGTVRDVTMVIHRMQHSMKFSCSPLFILSVDSLKNIMKVTYSTFSVLIKS
ncbi:odorant receptor 46a [Diachasma alloeum]|uniref:Odorant receptor n=1 Tax=Diachasma alloeum TaxID=454923 RepID=A0A4E0S3W6_9HYME|nr:odorant receptor 46a [Diachasma alloeum]THK33215.1 odorant receptor 112 [Diachasma alloeum]